MSIKVLVLVLVLIYIADVGPLSAFLYSGPLTCCLLGARAIDRNVNIHQI